ncbi:hypothetical protein G4V03_21065, partial [Escherichia coli]|nr:hypothetical protein [Escherichia coli]
MKSAPNLKHLPKEKFSSYSWYQARLFGAISTQVMIVVRFCDVCALYR